MQRQMKRHVCHILPPHLLRKIAENGTEDQRKQAIQTLTMSSRLRGRRDILGIVSTQLQIPSGQLNRTVYDAKGQETLPGALVRSEGATQTSSDVCVSEAYDGAGAVYDMLKSAFQRSSIDNRGLRLDSTVHYGTAYDNAFWDGRQMVYGDGDGKLFNRFTCALEVIGHEHFHGVTQYECNLDYYGESGALNEAISDIFGTVTKQYKLKQKFKDADWLIGAGLFTQHVRGVALRSMKVPGQAYDDPILGKDPQPSTMKNYVHTDEDEGGVHLNSGIVNHWFYLMCEILAESPAAGDAEISSWKTPGQIAYKALHQLRHTSNFKDFAAKSSLVAGELFGSRSKEQNACVKAWSGVGINLKK